MDPEICISVILNACTRSMKVVGICNMKIKIRFKPKEKFKGKTLRSSKSNFKAETKIIL
jgi:hypothetical protein